MTASLFRSPYYRVLSALLEYPGPEFDQVLQESEAFLGSPEGLRQPGAKLVLGVVEWMRKCDPMELQQIYVRTFDLTSAHSLHLTSHLLEEQDRRRGPALIRLRQHYEVSGLQLVKGELPDYLPAVLEFAATLGEESAVCILEQAEEALTILERNLQESGSQYSPLFTATCLAIKAGASAPDDVAVATEVQS